MVNYVEEEVVDSIISSVKHISLSSLSAVVSVVIELFSCWNGTFSTTATFYRPDVGRLRYPSSRLKGVEPRRSSMSFE